MCPDLEYAEVTPCFVAIPRHKNEEYKYLQWKLTEDLENHELLVYSNQKSVTPLPVDCQKCIILSITRIGSLLRGIFQIDEAKACHFDIKITEMKVVYEG